MNSIRLSLVTMLVAAFALTSFLAALNGYLSSMAEAEKLMDSQLAYASDILHSASTFDPDAGNGAEGSVEFIFQVWKGGELLARSADTPGSPINHLEEGFATQILPATAGVHLPVRAPMGAGMLWLNEQICEICWRKKLP